MSHLPDIDPAQAKVIDQRIGQGFTFLRDVLDRPGLLEKIPSGATLRFRDVALFQGQVLLHLTAYQTPAMPAWAATITGGEGVPTRLGHVETWHRHLPNGRRVSFHAAGETPEAALDALEAELRRADEIGALPG